MARKKCKKDESLEALPPSEQEEENDENACEVDTEMESEDTDELDFDRRKVSRRGWDGLDELYEMDEVE